MLALNGRLGWILWGAICLLVTRASCAQGLPADPGQWRLLSRAQVNPPGGQAFVETIFSYNQLKPDTGGDLILGFAAVPEKRKDTDVLVSRYVGGEDRWTAPVSIAGSTDLERSPAIWIDGASGAIHAAWVGNKRQKQGGPEVNSGSAIGDPRMAARPGHRRGIFPSGQPWRGAPT